MCHSMGNETDVSPPLTPKMALHNCGEAGDPARCRGVVGKNKAENSLEQTFTNAEAGVQGHNRGHADQPQHGVGNALNLPPLHFEVKGAAATAAYRLSYGCQWIGEIPGEGHTNVLDLMRRASPYTRMRQDRITATYSFSLQFPTREEWSTTTGPLGGQELIWFTDCSKMEEGTGLGLRLSNSKRETSISLGR